MQKKLYSIILLLTLLFVSACSPAAPAATPTTAAAAAKPTTTLTVLAAASLKESFTDMGKLFESKNPNVKVQFSFAGSQQLAQQLAQGAPADVFASASPKYMTAAIDGKRVDKASSQVFVKNRLVVVFPKNNPAGLKELKDLSKSGIKLVLADKSVPVGQYALDFLTKASKDTTYGSDFKDNVVKNVVSYEQDVKSVLTKVSMGEADGGIVYTTDITSDVANKVERIDIPDALNTIAEYPIATIVDAPNQSPAKDFVTLVLSAEGQQIMNKYGFITSTK